MRHATLQDERGFAMIVAIVLMALMLGLGIAALGLVDSESNRTREQRVRESTLQLDEGVLYAQSLVLSTKWASALNPYPSKCTSGGAADARCPNAATLAGSAGGANFANVDQRSGATWVTKVRDNGGPLANAYNPAQADLAQTTGAKTCPGPCTYDFNEDNQVWVQSQSTLRDGSAAKPRFKSRNVVARLRLEQLTENVPQVGVTAGALSVTNSGGHGGTPIIDVSGADVLVRCPDLTSPSCVDAKDGQVVPAPKAATVGNFMTAEQMARFKQRAITDGNYFPGCPTDDASGKIDLSGKVVWVEGCLNPPNLTSSAKTVTCSPPAGMDPDCVNTNAAPGLLIWHCARADFSGGFTFHGILYMANNSDGTCPASMPTRGDGTCVGSNVDNARDVFTSNGGFAVWGALAVDGPACMKVGSNGLQVKFDPNVFNSAQSYGTVGLVQNTWRELPPKAVS
jgi:hypothetical protein